MTTCWTSGTTQYPRTTVTIAEACTEVASLGRPRLWWLRLVPWTSMALLIVCVIVLLHNWGIATQNDRIRLLTERLDIYDVMRANDETRLRTVEEALGQVLQETRPTLRLPRGETPL